MDSYSTSSPPQEQEDIANEMPTDLSWKEVERMTDGFSEEWKIGSGGFGVVYKGVQQNGQEIAVKKLHHMPGVDEKQFRNEIGILHRLRHPNIVGLIGQSYEEQERYVEYNGEIVCAKMVDRVICLEYLHNGSLQNYISEESSGLPWHERYKIIKGICEGLNYLHANKIFHLDLKPANILLDKNMQPKIADFGLSKLFSGSHKSHTTTVHLNGTYGFMPPEYIEKGIISDKSDVFSLGAIIILIMSGRKGRNSDLPPQDLIEVVYGNWMRRLQNPESRDEFSAAYSNQILTCITIALDCLEPDWRRRPSMGNIIRDLNESEIILIGEDHTQVRKSRERDHMLSLTKSVLKATRSNVLSLIEEESKQLQDAQLRNIMFIIDELEMMWSFINVASEERARNIVVRTWVRQVRDIAFGVEDGIGFVHLDRSTRWWRRLLSPAAALPSLEEAAADEIMQLKDRTMDVSQRNLRYSLIISNSGSEPVMKRQSATTKEQEDYLWGLPQLITMEENSDLRVISMCGAGGDLDRTTALKKFYQDAQVRQNFEYRGWIKLTYPFNPCTFLQSLVIQFYKNACLHQETSTDLAELKRMERTEAKQGEIIEEFMKQVHGKRYLLILENVCTVAEWEAIRVCLPDNKKGNWVIISTDQHEIASLCIQHSYQVLALEHYSTEYPLYVFFKEGSLGKETRRVLSINDGTASRKAVACRWMDHFSLVGRESQMNELRNNQTTARFNDWQVMSVWGIAGVGKSVLVRNLYYERMLQKDNPIFDMYGWVHVSHPFNLRDFCRSLLWDLQPVSVEAMGVKDPVQECHKLLKGLQCLVVVDDVQSTKKWDLIQPALVSTHSKSVIIVITTEESIATYCAHNDKLVLNIKGLEAEASFDLFKKKVQKKCRASPLMNSNDKDVKQVIVNCGGLPKVIAAVANYLADLCIPTSVIASYMECIRTLNRGFMHELESSPEFGGLEGLFAWMHSYFRDCLDFPRLCIFYMSIFPRSQVIRRRRLVMRWVAEGYSRDTEDKTAEENGEMLFSMLVNLSMIYQSSTCRVITEMKMVLCQFSAFFHEYIISGSGEEGIMLTLKGHGLPITTRGIVRHLIIEWSWERDSTVFASIDLFSLRSLTVFGRWESFLISEGMKVLRVLDLENATGVTDEDLKQMVKILPRLKFLSLRGSTGIHRLPSSLGKLQLLETLDIRGTSIVTLPESITKIKKLRYMRAGSVPLENESSTTFSSPSCGHCQPVGVVLPTGIDILTALHTLGVVNTGHAAGKVTLKELRKIKQLRKLGVHGVNRKNSKEFCAAISCHVHLESLAVWLSNGNHDCLGDAFLSQNNPLQNLQSLKLYGLVRGVPVWMKYLPKLTKLELHITISPEVDIIKALAEIEELCILRLCVKPLQDSDGVLNFDVRVNGIQQPCYLKVKVFEITCSSKLNVSFGSEAMQNLELLTARCISRSRLKFFEIKDLAKLKLKEVRLIDSDGNAIKEMERQLMEHPRKPLLKLEAPDRC